ncbi:hypothetical protein CSB20_12205 [bacterium DOLZORAL124_64_63]|nr:MAG: hypothetical protein CSB20_12205 [bacterium DOLZORAL124_64_63]
MRYLLNTIPLTLLPALILVVLLGGATGCGEADNPVQVMADKTYVPPIPTTVDGIARWHNNRVEEMVQRAQVSNRPSLPDLETTLAEWGCLEQVDLASAREDWHAIRRFLERGARPEELANLVDRSLERVAAEPDLSPDFLGQLRRCMDQVLSDDRSRLSDSVDQLAAMARASHSPREKELAGILLGSTQRSVMGRRLPPDHPLHPLIEIYDSVGNFVSGPVVGAFCSSCAEIMICISEMIWPFW